MGHAEIDHPRPSEEPLFRVTKCVRIVNRWARGLRANPPRGATKCDGCVGSNPMPSVEPLVLPRNGCAVVLKMA
eukprot:1793687-Pyramimonas_sp.AAC.1